jgi:very-short-patch-repair endonuclease
MVSTDRLHNRLRYWKTQLIDTSKRNRLLFFRAVPASTVKLTEPPLQDIYTRLVEKEQPFQFYPLEPNENLLDFDENSNGEAETFGLSPLRADEVRSNLADKRLWRTLYSLRQKSRTSLQEQGIVTLFLAFGFLEWTEAPSSDIPVRSPLVLVPVELIQESSRDTYHLVLFEDEIAVNPTLVHLLSTNFGLTLPELPEGETLTLDAYFQAVSQAVCNQPKWSVVPEVYLGLFSFHKLSMYKDLEAHADRACEHPVVRALAGDASRLPHIPDGLPSAEDLDRVVMPLETFQILDADSSQQEAIQAAKRGVSFILQGPPGTGKSQTIANIIAERLADHKKVLFVSEKMAALEVVYRRLADRGLSEFCLQAHSHKANKKEVIQQLGSALEPARRPATTSDPDFSEFSRLKERLNAYVSALHTVRQPLNRTAYQAHGELARLLSAPDFHFDFERVETVTPGDLTRINEVLSELARVHDVIATYAEHPWFGVRIAQYNPNQTKSDIRAHFSPLVRFLSEAEETAGELADVCGVANPSTLSEIDHLIALAVLVERTPCPPTTWFLPEAPAPLIEAAKRYQARFNDYHQRRNALLQAYEPTLFPLPHTELILRLTERQKPLLERVLPGTKSVADTLIGQREALQSNLAHICELLDRLAKSLPALATSSGLDIPTTLVGIAQLCKAAEWIAHDPKPLADWFSRARLIELKAQVEEAGPYYAAYREEREQIKARYQDTVLSLDIAGLYNRFTGSYASLLRVLNPGYYRDLKQIRAELKASGKLSYDEATRDLRTARQALERKQWIEARTGEHSHAIGRHYNGLDTRWPDVLDAVETTRQLVDCLGENRIPAALQELLVESGSAIESVGEQRVVVQAELTRLEQELAGLQRTLSLQELPFTNKPLREADLNALRAWIMETAGGLADFLAAWDTVTACRVTNSELPERSVAEVIKDLQETQRLVQIETDVQTHAEELQAEFGHLFTGMNTRWEDVLAALDWTGQVLDWFGATPPSAFVAVASGEQSGAEKVPGRLASLRALRQRIDEETVFLHDLFSAYLRIENKAFAEAPIVFARAWVQLRLDRLADLDRWIDFQNLRTKCQQEGLATYLGLLCRDKPAADQFKPAFYKRFWALWLDKMYQTDSSLASFDGRRHEEYIARFRELDQSQLRIAQNRLRERLWRDRPAVGNGGKPTGEMSLLLREKAKKTRHKPLRRLFREIPNLLLALKPCLLMSPLSVATFLDPSVVEFDTVIFDEASQICSEDAVGAIMRGKQIIVVGDSKQLPPTRFFTAGAVENYDTEDEEEEAATEVYESILDECSTIGLSQWMLRWHYRSRCEALIAFSNRHFYDDKLVTFPGPQIPNAQSADRCVEFVPVPEGVYIRGKGQDAGTNRVEARKVAALVFQHFQSRPDRSLGVIAFSEHQQTAIDDELRRLRNLHPEYERFFSDQGEEPFFLKNLENVQGDERDTILFSVGYGHDQHGKLTMNFGPLNKEGGERRLNVAVTRAKHQVKLVCSIQPHDIDLSRTEKKGPALLKYYMEFAQRGPTALAREIEVPADPEFDSPFEAEVCQALEERGLTVHRQIGCAGYRIDLAIVDNEHPGRYLLGIECDGATYHSSKTARDRDRLRQQVLEEMGWRGRILRIWSSDWIQNREAQVARVLQALENARYTGEDGLSAEEADNENSLGEESEAIGLDREDATESEDDLLPLPTGVEPDDTLPEGVMPYRAFLGERQGEPSEFYALAEYKPGRITDVLVSVVEQEGPIHILEATRRVVACWGMGKAGANLLKTVQVAATRAHKRGSIVVRDDFLWPSEMTQAVVRVPSDENSVRNIDYVPLEEIAEACILCVHDAYAIQQDELITQAARLLGYHRTGANVRERISEAIAYASKQGAVEVKEGAVRLR